MTHEEFRTTYGEAIKELENKNTSDNIFKILRLERYEIRHSNFLIWLLRDFEFRKLFIRECCGIKEDKLSDNEIEHISGINREEPFTEIDEREKKILTNRSKNNTKIDKNTLYRSEDKNDVYKLVENNYNVEKEYQDVKPSEINNRIQRYIDINIIGDNFTMTIENKIDSLEHDFQCIAYRNYMECNYKEKKTKFFVFLTKAEKTEGFEPDNPKNKFYKYIYVNYAKVKDILMEYSKKLSETDSSLKRQYINQYIAIIDGWTNFPYTEYQEIFGGLDLSPFINEYEKLLNIALTDSEEDFILTARKYCECLKSQNDLEIKPILEAIVKKPELIKDDYGRATKDSDKVKYAYALYVFHKTAQAAGFKYVDKKDNVIKTLDYSAHDGINIGIYAGLNVPRSKLLVSYIMDNAEVFLQYIKEQLKDWDCQLKCSFLKPGFNPYHDKGGIYGEVELDLKKLTEDDFNIIDPNYIGRKTRDKTIEILDKLEKEISKKEGDNNFTKNISIINDIRSQIRSEIEKSKETKPVVHWIVRLDYRLKDNDGKEIKEITDDNKDYVKQEFVDKTIQAMNLYQITQGRKNMINIPLGDAYAKACFTEEVYNDYLSRNKG
ncbi:MAG: PD-(D/E)XK nuclease family protein [Oscillospiraceae bacterium]